MTVSVIIPCYNVADYVPECLASVYAQTYSDLEVICVDNRSSDDTLGTLQHLQATHYPDLVVLEEERPGAPHARNSGLEVTSGAWVQFLDADDLLLPDKIERQVSIATEKTGFVAGGYIRRAADGSERVSRPEENPWKGVFATRLGITSANLFKRSSLQGVGGWRTTLTSSQEYDLMFRLLRAGAVPAIDLEPLTVKRARPAGQISQQDGTKTWGQYVELRIEMMQYLREHQPDEWRAHESFYLQQFFDALRALANHDLRRAAAYANTYLPPDFRPSPSGATTERYLQAYRWLGFRGAEIVKRIVSPA
jgi:glycosyltransferase involved in cell wall biosynthesis